MWNHRHGRLKSRNQLVFSSGAFRHQLSLLFFPLTAHNLCCLYARIDCAQCRSRTIEQARQGGRCSIDHSAVFLLHSCPWSLEPVRAVDDIHMLSIHRSRLQAASLDTLNSVAYPSGVPKRGRSKRRRCSQKRANERKRAQTKVHKRAQESAKGRKREKSASA